MRDLDLKWDIGTGAFTFDRDTGNYVKRGETVVLSVIVEENENDATLPEGAIATLKAMGNYLTALVQWSSFVQVGDTNVYTAQATVSSADIDTLLGTTLDFVNCVLDIAGEGVDESDTIALPLRNNVTRDNDTAPTVLVSRNDFYVTNGTGLLVNVAAGILQGASVAAQASIAISNGTNYVQMNSSGVASSNQSGFTDGYYPLATVVASGGVITSNTDRRQWIDLKGGGSTSLIVGTTGVSGASANDILISNGTTLQKIGSSVVGRAFVSIPSPGAFAYPQVNDDDSVSLLNAASLAGAIGAVTTGDTGTVTNTMLANSSITIGSSNVSLGGTLATVNGLTLGTSCALGTPASGNLTNCTSLPISTGVSGLATGIATFLATPSSANLRAALTDETGTGAAVFGTTPTITTPELAGVVHFVGTGSGTYVRGVGGNLSFHTDSGASNQASALQAASFTAFGNSGADYAKIDGSNGGFLQFKNNGFTMTVLPPAAIAANSQLSVPNVASGTFVTTGDTGTVTNAMLAGSIDLTTKVTGVLPVANGGTGLSALGTGVASALGTTTNASGGILTGNTPSGWYFVPGFVNGEDSLRFAVGNTYSKLAQFTDIMYTPPSGGVRDPRLYYANGTYYMAYTPGNFGNQSYVSIASSTDLQTWSWLCNVSTASIGAVTQSWLGDWVIDGGNVYLLVSVSTDNDVTMAMYLIQATNSALTTWGTPTAITGTGIHTKVIGQTIKKIGSTYYLSYKQDTTKYNEFLSSSSLASGYTVWKSGDFAGWGSALEGFGLVNVSGSTWVAYLDAYNSNLLYYTVSTDNLATWSAKALVDCGGKYFSNPGINLVDSPTFARDIERLICRNAQRSAMNYYKDRPTDSTASSLVGPWLAGKVGLLHGDVSNYQALYVFVNIAQDSTGAIKSIDTSKPGWLLEIGYGSSVDDFKLYRCTGGSGSRSLTNLMTVSSSGGLTMAGPVAGTTGSFSSTVGVAGVTTLTNGTATPAGGSTSARTLMGTTAGFGIYYGSGAPTVSAAKGSLYLRSDGSTTNDRMYVNTDGGTTWTAVTTAA